MDSVDVHVADDMRQHLCDAPPELPPRRQEALSPDQEKSL